MPRDVIITPLSGLIDFKDLAGNNDAYIQINDSGDLTIANPGGTLSIGNLASNLYIGDGTTSVDIIFEQSGKIRALTNKTLTLGQSDSFVTTASPFGFLSPDGSKQITARMLNTDVLSFQGGTGELLSISGSLTGTIFTVNDVSGIPSIEVIDTGLVKFAQYSGNVVIGSATDLGQKFQVAGTTALGTNLANYLTVTGATTGNVVNITTAGSDVNIGLTLTTKGTGSIIIDTGTSTGNVEIKPGASNLLLWDDDSSHYYRFVTGNRTANYDITLPAGSVTLTAGTSVVDTRSINTTAPLSGGGNLSADRTLSLAAGYGDTLNPFGSKTANFFLAAPNGAAGVPTFRAIVAADIPTLNQNTTGSAATLTTTRTIWGQNFNGSANVTGALSSVTTLSMSGQLTNSVATGTAPLSVASTTVVANLNADLLDGLDSTSFLRSNANTTYSGGLFTVTTPAGSLGSNTGQVNTLQVYQATLNTDAFMSFHVAGDYAVHFGVDGTSNDLFVGGWSAGAVKNRVIHAGNLVTSGSTTVSTVKYNGTTAAAGQFDGGTTTPSGTTRLNYGGYFYPSFINLAGSGDTATSASHYFVETGSDGFVRPKTLANVRTEIVTSAAINSAIATATTTSTSGAFAAPFLLNANTISANYTIPVGYNAVAAGPVTVANGIVVTVSDGSTWVIV